MDFLGLGPLEILLVLIVGFLLFGPEKLPGMAARASEWYRKFTKTTSTIAKSLTEEVSAESKSRPGATGSVNDTNVAGSDEARAVPVIINSPGQEISQKAAETGKTITKPGEKTAG
jgi:Sec-independent protein translocase protein TatA